MSLNYDIYHDDDKITRVVIHEQQTLQELMQIVGEVAEQHPYKLRMYDVREFTFNMSHEEIQNISEFGKQKFKDPSRLAILVNDKLSYGVIRMFEAYRSQGDFVHVRVFWEYEDAVAWLLNEEKDIPS